MAASKFTKNYECFNCPSIIEPENKSIKVHHKCKCGERLECSKRDICKNNCGEIRRHNIKCKLKSTFECKKCKQTKSIKLYNGIWQDCQDCLDLEKSNSRDWELEI